MGLERSKKPRSWKKAAAHFAFCFLIGFLTSTATTRESLRFNQKVAVSLIPPFEEQENTSSLTIPNLRSQRALIIAITPTSRLAKHLSEASLRRLAQTLKLVPPPVLWIVAEGSPNDGQFSKLLRATGLMYRHLPSNQNYTDREEELQQLRQVALRHVELHKIVGIVHFAELDNYYDLAFFDALREIESFGTWTTAVVGSDRHRVMFEGPASEGSQVIGIVNFSFNSSVLWDPERWGRYSSYRTSSMDSVNFVKQAALENDKEMLGFELDGRCSRIMVWRLDATKRN